MKCSYCTAVTDKMKMPPRWHRNPAGNPVCPKCWAERYILRAITLPVSAPVEIEWAEFRPLLADAWNRATNAANWAVKRLLANDVVRDASMTTLPKMPPVYLYGDYPETERTGWSQSLASVLRTVEANYRARRYELVWQRAVLLPNTKYPYPYPLHNVAWKVERSDGGEPLITLTLPGKRVTLRLRFGQRGQRNRIPAAFDQIVSGMAIQCEASVFRRRADGTHRNGDAARDSGGQRTQYEVCVKLVAWFPRPKQEPKTGRLYVTSGQDGLLSALDAKDSRLWTVHADHVKRWFEEHKRLLDRWSDDQKREERPRASFASRREASSEKYRRRMATAVKEFAAQLLNFAVRRRFAEIEWIEPDKRYMAGAFPWAAMFARIATKADEAAVTLRSFPKGESNGDE